MFMSAGFLRRSGMAGSNPRYVSNDLIGAIRPLPGTIPEQMPKAKGQTTQTGAIPGLAPVCGERTTRRDAFPGLVPVCGVACSLCTQITPLEPPKEGRRKQILLPTPSKHPLMSSNKVQPKAPRSHTFKYYRPTAFAPYSACSEVKPSNSSWSTRPLWEKAVKLK